MNRIALAFALLASGASMRSAAAAPVPESDATPLPSVALPAELARVLTDYETAWRKGDGAALARLFDSDGFVLSSGAPPVRGREAIERFYGGGHGSPLVLRAFAFSTAGDLGYILGGFARQEGSADVGKYTLTLHRGADGKWLIVSDMDNGNARPQ